MADGSEEGANGGTAEVGVPPNLDQWMGKFERRTYITFVSRARASRRLEVRGILWMISLSVASAAALCASMFSLAIAPRPVSQIDLAAALFSLATLVLSLIVSALNYQSRSRDLFHSFRAAQRVSSQIESLRETSTDASVVAEERPSLELAYQDALDQSENHTTLDYHRARPVRDDSNKKSDERARNRALFLQGSLTGLPVLIILVSLYWLLTIFTGL